MRTKGGEVKKKKEEKETGKENEGIIRKKVKTIGKRSRKQEEARGVHSEGRRGKAKPGK